MDEFDSRLQTIPREELKAYLRSLSAPCYESQLFKIAFPAIEITQVDPLTLYQNHFLLFHLLYQLQEEFYREHKYLFVHFMRTILLPYPEVGKCRFFDEHLTVFCHRACIHDKNYCPVHAKIVGETALEELSVKYFYADKNNFYTLDEETATAFINGAWEIFSHYGTYQRCFEVLGVPEAADTALIKKTFKRLAKQYHPDRGSQSREKFIEVNNAYQFLLRVLPGMKKSL